MTTESLAGHTLLAHIGDGGMGVVWLGRGPHGLAAVKTLKDDHAGDIRVRSMFLKEMRVASSIRHPNVAAVLDSGEERGVPYIVMEWIDGRSLRAVERASAERGGIPLAVALRIAHDVCAGLHAAHELASVGGELVGLVHRDVSPQNVLVSRDGTTKLIDFGVAKVREAVTGDTTSSGGIKGKVRYMAPEQALGRRIDRRAVIFALGAVLYEMVTGRPPIEGPNDLAILRTLLSSEAIDVPASVPEAVRVVLARALAKKASQRFSTAAEMQHAIAVAMTSLDGVATEADVASFVCSVEPNDALRSRIDDALAHDPHDATMQDETRETIFAAHPPTASMPPTFATTKRPPWGLAFSAASAAFALVVFVAARGPRHDAARTAVTSPPAAAAPAADVTSESTPAVLPTAPAANAPLPAVANVLAAAPDVAPKAKPTRTGAGERRTRPSTRSSSAAAPAGAAGVTAAAKTADADDLATSLRARQ